MYVEGRRGKRRSKKRYGDIIESNLWWVDLNKDDAGNQVSRRSGDKQKKNTNTK